MAAPSDQQPTSGAGATVFVPGPHGWLPAPPGYVPPLGWIPTDRGWQPAPPGWTPPPWWVQTPSGWLPPQQQASAPAQQGALGWADGAPDAATRGFGWPRVLPRTLQQAARRGDRTPSGWEILVVLAVFPLQAVVSALVSLAQTLADYSSGDAHTPTLVPHQTAVSTVLFALLELSTFAPALLVWYLLKLSGGGLRGIGLDRSQVKTDVARSGKITLYAFALPILVGSGLLTNLTPHHQLLTDTSVHFPVAYLVPYVIGSIGAGVVEEIVVLGFLVHRLEQRGWDGWRLYAVCITVRASYHLYYGVPVLGFALWGGLMVMFYRAAGACSRSWSRTSSGTPQPS